VKSPGKIVVVDDVQANVDLLRGLLTPEGYEVHTASDGAAALDLVARKMPDVVLSDIIMPKLNGFELCRRIKENRATRLIPVVLITALGEREDRIEGINAGADATDSKRPRSSHDAPA
jgi:two-component system cell cycle response regulator